MRGARSSVSTADLSALVPTRGPRASPCRARRKRRHPRRGARLPRFCHDGVADGCDDRAVPQTLRNCFEVAVLNAVRKTPWLFRALARDVQAYVSRGWNSTDGCPRMPRALRTTYERRHGAMDRHRGGSELALLLAVLERSRVPYVGISLPYGELFDRSPEERRALLGARTLVVLLPLHAHQKVGRLLYVVRQLLLEEGVRVSFGFVEMARKKGDRHVAAFTVCDGTALVLCDTGACTTREYDDALALQKYRADTLLLVVHNPRGPVEDRPFQL